MKGPPLDVRLSSYAGKIDDLIKIARLCTERYGGFLAGGLAALLHDGLPRLPRDIDILIRGLDRICHIIEGFTPGEHFREMDVKKVVSSYVKELVYVIHLRAMGRQPDVEITLLNEIDESLVDEVDGIRTYYGNRDRFVEWKVYKVMRGRATTLDLLDLWYFGVDVEPLIEEHGNRVHRLDREYVDRLVPPENIVFYEDIEKMLERWV